MSRKAFPVRIILPLVLAGVLGCTLAPASPGPGSGSPTSWADMVLIPDDVAGVRTALLAALRSGRLPADRLDASVRRILRLKLGHAEAWGQRPPLSVVGLSEHRAVVQRILDAAGAATQ